MKEKDIIKGAELERINDELFGLFDPEDESWIIGGSTSLTTLVTYSPHGFDSIMDFDFPEAAAQ